jgi:hypothetical protein
MPKIAKLLAALLRIIGFAWWKLVRGSLLAVLAVLESRGKSFSRG